MLFVVTSYIIMLAFLHRSYKEHKLDLMRLQKRHELFALRDKLRNARIKEEEFSRRSGEQLLDDNLFMCLDTTISKVIGSIGSISLWNLVAFIIEHEKDEELNEAFRNFQSILRKPENQELKTIHEEYVKILMELLFLRHIFLIKSITKIRAFYSQTASWKDRIIKALLSSPETSTVSEYCRP